MGSAGGGSFGAIRVERAITIGCAAGHAGQLVYMRGGHGPRSEEATPIGVASAAARDARLGQRFQLVANSFPTTSGRQAYRLGSPMTDYTGTFKNTPRYREPIAGLLSDPAGVG